MSVNLLDLAKTYLTNEVTSQVSTMLGEEQEPIQKAFDGALLIILNALIQKSAEPGGGSSIMDMVGQATTPDRTSGDVIEPVGGLSGNLSNRLKDNLQLASLLSMGTGMIQSLLGDRTNAITGALASYSGIKSTSATSLMGIAGPVLLSVLGKKMGDEERGVSGLGSLLASQSTNIQVAGPPEFNALISIIPGFSFVRDLTSKKSVTTATPTDPFAPSVAPKEVAPPRTTPVATVSVKTIATKRPLATSMPSATLVMPPPMYTNNDGSSSGGGNRWFLWLMLVLSTVALFVALRSCRQYGTGVTKAAANSVGTSMNDAASTLGATTESVGCEPCNGFGG